MAAGASASGSHSMKISFQGPVVVTSTSSTLPTSAEKVTTYSPRGGDTGPVVQESLGPVSGCEQNTLAADASMPGGQGAASSGACQMFSDAPVAVGVKSVPLNQFPNLPAARAAAASPPAAPGGLATGRRKPTRTSRSARKSRRTSPICRSNLAATSTTIRARTGPRRPSSVCPHARSRLTAHARPQAGRGLLDRVLCRATQCRACWRATPRASSLFPAKMASTPASTTTRSQNWMYPGDDTKTFSYKIRMADDAVTNMGVLVYALGQCLNLDSSSDPDNAMYN